MMPLSICRSSARVHTWTSDGKRIALMVDKDATVIDTMSLIQAKEGTPPDQQRLVFRNSRLEESKTLSEYNIEPNSKLHMVLRLRAVGSWTDGELPILDSKSTLDERLAIIRGTDGPALHRTIQPNFNELPSLLNGELCGAVISFINQHGNVQVAGTEEADLRLEVSFSELANLLGSATLSSLASALTKMAKDAGAPMSLAPRYVLRRSIGIGEGHLAYHRDYNYATLNISLNADDEYDGGRLSIVTEDMATEFTRPSGHAVLMNTSVVHGVSRLVSGTRYGLLAFVELEDTTNAPDHGFPHLAAAVSDSGAGCVIQASTCSLLLLGVKLQSTATL